MELFESSGNWIMALGKTLLHSLWIGLLILSVLKILLQFITGRYSRLRYRLAVASLIIYIGSATLMFLSFYSPADNGPASGSAGLIEPLSMTLFDNLFQQDGRSVFSIICYICSYIYFSGIFVMCIRAAISIRKVRTLKNCSSPATGYWANRFIQIKEAIGIKQKADLLISDGINSPGIIGIFKPVILVPAGMLSNLPVGQVETILMHELYHLRRLDFLVNLIQLFVEALFFFNPAVWAISHQIRIEREKCCDDRVLDLAGRPEEYARALFQIARLHQEFTILAPSASGTNQYQLFNRIKRILNQSTMKSNIREKLYALLLMAGGVILLFALSGFSQGISIIQHDYFVHEVNPVPEVEISAIPVEVIQPDTIPEPDAEEIEAAKKEALEDIDWEEMKKDMEAARKEAFEDIDWDEIKKDMEAARKEAFEDIDWDEIKKEMEHSRVHIDSILKDFNFEFDQDFDFDVDIDFDQMKIDLEEAMKELKEINWEEIQEEIGNSMAELEKIDVEQIRIEVEKAMKELESEKE